MDNGKRDFAAPEVVLDPFCRNPGRQFLNMPRILDRGIEYDSFNSTLPPDAFESS